MRQEYELPEEYLTTLKKYSLNEEDIIRYQGTVRSPMWDKIHWESHLANLYNRTDDWLKETGEQVKGRCSKAIAEYLWDVNQQAAHQILMIFPGCCSENIIRGINHAKKALCPKVYCLWHTPNCIE